MQNCWNKLSGEGDPKAYQKAQDFYARFSKDDNNRDERSDLRAWKVLNCRASDLCREVVLNESFANVLDPIELSDIYERVDELQQKITKRERIGFADYRRPLDFVAEDEAATYVTREEISWATEF